MNFHALQRFLRVRFPSEASGTLDSVFEMYLAHSIYLSFQPLTKKGPKCPNSNFKSLADIWPMQQNISKSLHCKYENMIIQFEPSNWQSYLQFTVALSIESDFDRTKYLVGN